MFGRFMFTLVLLFTSFYSLSLLHAEAAWLDPPGTEYVEISDCAGQLGYNIPLAGNVATPVAAYGSDEVYIAYISDPSGSINQANQVVITKYDGSECTTPVELTTIPKVDRGVSHHAPSVYVDRDGFIYVTHSLGFRDYNQGGPYILRSTDPNNISSFTIRERMHFPQNAETNGLTLKNGNVLIGGTDIRSRFEIIEPYDGGSENINYKFDTKQVVDSLYGATAGNTNHCKGNRFTKGYYQEGVGTDNNIYIVWGWGGTGGDPHPCKDGDMKKYTTDSHEVFFAYSDDGGITWRNTDNTASIAAADCPKPKDCRGETTEGIKFNQDDFRISTMRQREHRQLWADPDGTIYITFLKSDYCDSGTCTNGASVTDPGQLMLLKFKLGDSIHDVIINEVWNERHLWLGAIRKHDDELYIWANEQGDAGSESWDMYEYVSTDDGETWRRTQLNTAVTAGCARMHGETYNPRLKNSVRLIWSCSSYKKNNTDEIFYYRRSFDYKSELPGQWKAYDIGLNEIQKEEVRNASEWLEDGTFYLHSNGIIDGKKDTFRYVSRSIFGDFEFTVKLLEVENNQPSAFAGIMVRDALDAGSDHAILGITGEGGSLFKSRSEANGATSEIKGPKGKLSNRWLKLTRNEDMITSYISDNGIDWVIAGEQELDLGQIAYIGLAAASGHNKTIASAAMTNVKLYDAFGTLTGYTNERTMAYKVQPGDSLWTISRNIGTSWTRLQEINQLSDPDKIYPNQRLLVPSQ